MENTLRNEVEITLAGEVRTMRASFTAIVAIEKALGKGMPIIINQLLDGQSSVTEYATIIFHGLRGYDDKRLSFEAVGEAIVDGGVKSIIVPVMDFVSRSLNGVKVVGKPEGTETPQ